MGQTQKRSSRFPPTVTLRATELIQEGHLPTDIQRKLHLDPNIAPADVPSTKTIGKWRSAVLTRGSTEPWLVIDADPDDARLVLPALLELIRRTEGRMPHLTKSEGDWIARLRVAQPSLPEWEAIKLARRYIAAGDDPNEMLALDRYLAAALWEASSGKTDEAVSEGVITYQQLDLIDGDDMFGTPVHRLR